MIDFVGNCMTVVVAFVPPLIFGYLVIRWRRRIDQENGISPTRLQRYKSITAQFWGVSFIIFAFLALLLILSQF